MVIGAGRDASARRDRAAGRPLRRAGHDAAADGRLPRDHPQAGCPCAAATRSSRAATASSATWCSTSSRCRAAPASSSRTDHRRRGAAQLFPVGGAGRRRIPQAGAARLPGGGRRGGAGRRLLSRRRFLRHGVPHRRPHRHARGHAAVPSGAARADPQGGDRCPRRRQRQINGIVSRRRGQILGFDTRAGWAGWDVVRAQMPEGRDPRPDHRVALGDGGRRHVHGQVRSYGGTDRPDCRSDRGGNGRRSRRWSRLPGGLSEVGRAARRYGACTRAVSARYQPPTPS